jgi:tRNA G46 methylase TrmB
MRYLPNFFRQSQMEKIFICFPDPHFKTKNFRRRIVSHPLLSEYAFLLKPGGRLYTCTG